MIEQHIDDADDIEIRFDEESTAGYVSTVEGALGAVTAGSGVLLSPLTLGASHVLTLLGACMMYDAYQTAPQIA